jgi:hypothetical protein
MWRRRLQLQCPRFVAAGALAERRQSPRSRHAPKFTLDVTLAAARSSWC